MFVCKLTTVCFIDRCWFQGFIIIWVSILWHVSYFLAFWWPSRFRVRKKWKQGCQKTQRTFFIWARIQCFFDGEFWMILWKFLCIAFLRFWSPKCLKWKPLGPPFILFGEQVEIWNLCFRVGQTQFFIVFRCWDIGQLFSGCFLRWLGGWQFTTFVEF